MDISLKPMRRLAAARTPLAVLLALCALAFLLILAFGAPPRPLGLDPSWTEVLAWGFLNHAQWGRDLIFTYGPLGFLQPYASYVDGIFPWYATGEILLPSAFALTIGLLLRRAELGVSALFALAYVASCAMLAGDVSWAMTLLFGSVFLVGRSAERFTIGTLAVVIVLAPAFAAIALAKFSLFPLWALCVALLSGAQFLVGQRRRALLFAGGFALALVLLWLACGQHLSSLPLFISASLEIASGYPHAMGDRAPLLYETLGLALLGLFVLTCVYAAWHARTNRLALASLCLIALAAVLFWLAFFTRGDHWPWFYPAMTLLPFALLCSPHLAGIRHLRAALVVVVVLAVCIVPPPRTVLDTAAFRVRNSIYNLTHLPELGAIRKGEWQSLARDSTLPKITGRVGKARIDMVTWEQGMLLINGLNYAPRPVFQSYSAYTPRLARMNEAYFLGADAPAFVLFKLDYIDGRLPMSEDGLALLALLRLYRPVLSEKGFLLLQRDAAATAAAIQVPAEAPMHTTLGADVAVGDTSAAIAAFVHVNLNAFGKIYTLLFREPVLRITLKTTSGQTQRFRLVRATAASGFMLSPIVEGNNDWVKFYFSKPLRFAQSLSVDTDSAWERAAFENDITVRFQPVDHLQADPATVSTDLGGMLLYPGFNLLPSGTAELRTVVEEGQEAVFLHAPGTISFQPQPGRYRVTAIYGLQRIAINDSGCIRAKPDGIGVALVLRHGGKESVLSHTEIDPFGSSRDAGPHRLVVDDIDIAAGDELDYRVDSGPAGTNVACDWSYVRDFTFMRKLIPVGAAATAAVTYPGFNLAPLTAGLRVVVDDGKESVFLHAPAGIAFQPTPGRYNIAATYGLQGVALTDPGCIKAGADGVGISLVLRHDGKESILQHVEVDPFRLAKDRGPQQLAIDGIEVAAGDRVDWRVDPGHGGSNTSCDWSYVRNLVFRRTGAGEKNSGATGTTPRASGPRPDH